MIFVNATIGFQGKMFHADIIMITPFGTQRLTCTSLKIDIAVTVYILNSFLLGISSQGYVKDIL